MIAGAAVRLMSDRTPTPAKLPSALPGTHDENATVVEAFTLHYGRTGPTLVEPGARCRISDADEDAGLCRFSSGAAEGALCALRHFRLDDEEAVRHAS